MLGLALTLWGCGDRCDRVCGAVAEQIDACRGDAPWSDFGASRRANWITRCQAEWDSRSGDLNTRDLELALAICDDALVTVADLPCEDVIALYGTGD